MYIVDYSIFKIFNVFIVKEASKPENRAKQPWIIAMGHRPMYCSNNDHDDCTHHESLVCFSLTKGLVLNDCILIFSTE